MDTKKRMEAKNEFEKKVFKLMIYSVFGKTMKNLRKLGGIKLVTADEKRSKLISEPNCHTTKCFFRKIVSNRNEKKKTKNNKSKNE